MQSVIYLHVAFVQGRKTTTSSSGLDNSFSWKIYVPFITLHLHFRIFVSDHINNCAWDAWRGLQHSPRLADIGLGLRELRLCSSDSGSVAAPCSGLHTARSRAMCANVSCYECLQGHGCTGKPHQTPRPRPAPHELHNWTSRMHTPSSLNQTFSRLCVQRHLLLTRAARPTGAPGFPRPVGGRL